MTGGPPRARLDPTDPTFSADPFPRYAALRSEGPAVAVDLPNGRAAWVVTSYEHARAVLSDRRMLAAPPERDRGPARCDLESHMLNADGPEHARLRRLVSGALGRSAVEALRVADVFRAKVVDTTTASFIFELTGTPEKIDSFIAIMRELGLVEVGRTGIVGMTRGPEGA